MLQARMLRPYTEKFFRAAGLAAGMRVLDIGSGMGDVALLSADIVGPGGRVLGIDRDAAALDKARRRAEEQGCSSWVEFQTSNLDEFATPDQFDALVGRYVLLYQPDPSSVIRSLLRSVKQGGIVVFHEFDLPGPESQLSSLPSLRSGRHTGGRGIPPWRGRSLRAAARQDATRRRPPIPNCRRRNHHRWRCRLLRVLLACQHPDQRGSTTCAVGTVSAAWCRCGSHVSRSNGGRGSSPWQPTSSTSTIRRLDSQALTP